MRDGCFYASNAQERKPLPNQTVQQHVCSLVAQALFLDGPEGSTEGDRWLKRRLGGITTAQSLEPGLSDLNDSALTAIGQLTAHRLLMDLANLFCSNRREDAELRGLLSLTERDIISSLYLALTTGLGVSPNAATILAALIFRNLPSQNIGALRDFADAAGLIEDAGPARPSKG